MATRTYSKGDWVRIYWWAEYGSPLDEMLRGVGIEDDGPKRDAKPLTLEITTEMSMEIDAIIAHEIKEIQP